MNKEKLCKIYDMIIKDEEITLWKLDKYEITLEEFIHVINDNLIEKISDNKYRIKDFGMLYNCGVGLINSRDYIKGCSYLEFCYKINKNSSDLKLYLLLGYIGAKKYQNALELLNANNCCNLYDKDYNLILYMMSIIVEVDEDCKKKVLGFEDNDVLILNNVNNYNKINKHNVMRKFILDNKLHQAKNMYLRELIHQFPNKMISEIIYMLLQYMIDVDYKRNLIIIDYLKNKNYLDLLVYIKRKQQQTKLCSSDKIVYTIVKDMLWIDENRKIPKPRVNETSSLEEAIKGKNYYLALKIITESKTDICDKNLKKEVINLLVDINKLIKNVVLEYKESKAKSNENELVKKLK